MAKRNIAINDLAKIKSLERIWDEMRKKTKSNKKNIPVSGDISVNHFEQFRSYYIKRISSDLRARRFSFSHLRPYFIEKESGGTRVICVPTLQDRLVQRATLRLLADRGYSFSTPGSYGFVEGRSVPEACKRSAELRAKKPWVLKTDISNFFDNIPRNILKEIVKKKVKVASLHPILNGAIDCDVKTRNKFDQKRLEECGITEGRGVRQGMPLAPYLSNILLYKFDQVMSEEGLSMVRYADDIAFFCSSRSEAERALKFVKENLYFLGLSVPELYENSKTMIYDPASPVEFLGVNIGRNKGNGNCPIYIGDNQVNKMKKRIRDFSDLDFCIENGISLLNFQRKLGDIIGGYEGAYAVCENRDSVIDSLNDLSVSTYNKILKKEIGVDAKRLTLKQKVFLGIE